MPRREAAWGGKKLSVDDRLCVKAYGRIFAFEWRRSNCRRRSVCDGRENSENHEDEGDEGGGARPCSAIEARNCAFP